MPVALTFVGEKLKKLSSISYLFSLLFNLDRPQLLFCNCAKKWPGAPEVLENEREQTEGGYVRIFFTYGLVNLLTKQRFQTLWTFFSTVVDESAIIYRFLPF
jgi:hypothetical protein